MIRWKTPTKVGRYSHVAWCLVGVLLQLESHNLRQFCERREPYVPTREEATQSRLRDTSQDREAVLRQATIDNRVAERLCKFDVIRLCCCHFDDRTIPQADGYRLR
jgi:hypothetical protein